MAIKFVLPNGIITPQPRNHQEREQLRRLIAQSSRFWLNKLYPEATKSKAA